MKKERLIQVVRLQENLASVRKIAGWTSEKLGEMLGVSKQNISNLENNNTKLSQAQYIAIRHFLDYYIISNPESDVFSLIIYLLLDCLEITGDSYNSLKRTVQDISAAASTMSKDALNVFATTLLKATYTRYFDLAEIDSPIKTAMESYKKHDWTADIMEGKI